MRTWRWRWQLGGSANVSDASTRVLVPPVVAGPANAATNLHSCGCRAGATHQVIDRGSATFGMFSHAGWCQQRQPARPLDPTRPPRSDRGRGRRRPTSMAGPAASCDVAGHWRQPARQHTHMLPLKCPTNSYDRCYSESGGRGYDGQSRLGGGIWYSDTPSPNTTARVFSVLQL